MGDDKEEANNKVLIHLALLTAAKFTLDCRDDAIPRRHSPRAAKIRPVMSCFGAKLEIREALELYWQQYCDCIKQVLAG